MNNILTDLQKIKAECIPQEKKTEIKNMDKYQQKRYELLTALKKLGENIKKLQEKEKRTNVSNYGVIALKNENRKAFKGIENLYSELKQILAKSKTKRVNKLSAEELNNRSTDVIKFGEQIRIMGGQINSNIHIISKSRNEQKRIDREKRRKRKDKNREPIDGMKLQFTELDESEQRFMDKVNDNRKREDAQLDEISKGLEELKNLGQAIGSTLTHQDKLLRNVNHELQVVDHDFVSSNERLQELLEAQGGTFRWLPRICCLVILLSIVGYLVTIMS